MRASRPSFSAACSALAFGAMAFAIVGCSSDDAASAAAPTPAVLTDAGNATPNPIAPPVPTTTTSGNGNVTAPDAGPPKESEPPLDVPASLVAALGGNTYVEGSCTPATYPGWPHPAKKCTYRTNLSVTIANPEPDRVARWIVDASKAIPSLDGLYARDRANWEAGLLAMAKHMMLQSSRIFPLEGQVWENGTAYVFERGVTKTCSSGCYCRVNSTSRQQWCKYADAALGLEDEAACLAKYGKTSNTLTAPWLAHCFDNHVAAWTADRNEHFRAQAWNANLAISAQFPNPATAAGADVVAAIKDEYPTY